MERIPTLSVMMNDFTFCLVFLNSMAAVMIWDKAELLESSSCTLVPMLLPGHLLLTLHQMLLPSFLKITVGIIRGTGPRGREGRAL